MADLVEESKPQVVSPSAARISPQPVVMVPPSCYALGQEGNSRLALDHAAMSTPSRPELTFSIERILGLSSRSTELPRTPMRKPSILGNVYVARNHYNLHEDDDDDADEDDREDEEDAESIEVEDPTPMDCSERDIFMAAYSNLGVDGDAPKYQWLQCTRYHPPKVQRSKKKEGTKRRKLGRNPRVPFTQHQVSVLEDKFRHTHYLSSMDVAELSTTLNLTETRVKIWFQNRRARERRDKEASQRNQVTTVSKSSNFQPLTIPSVAWPISASLPPASYAQFQGAMNYRQGYLPSGFSFFNNARDSPDVRTPSAYPEKRPGTGETTPRQLVKFQ